MHVGTEKIAFRTGMDSDQVRKYSVPHHNPPATTQPVLNIRFSRLWPATHMGFEQQPGAAAGATFRGR